MCESGNPGLSMDDQVITSLNYKPDMFKKDAKKDDFGVGEASKQA